MHAIELVNIIHVSPKSSLSSSLSWRSSLSLPFYWPYSAPGLQLHLICFAKETSNETTRLIIEATSNSNMCPFTRKRFLRFAVFAWIAARMPCISRSNGSGYPCKENLYPFERLRLSVQRKFVSVRTARYPCKENLHPFEWLALFVRKKFASVRTAGAIHAKKFVIHSNGSGCLF